MKPIRTNRNPICLSPFFLLPRLLNRHRSLNYSSALLGQCKLLWKDILPPPSRICVFLYGLVWQIYRFFVKLSRWADLLILKQSTVFRTKTKLQLQLSSINLPPNRTFQRLNRINYSNALRFDSKRTFRAFLSRTNGFVRNNALKTEFSFSVLTAQFINEQAESSWMPWKAR